MTVINPLGSQFGSLHDEKSSLTEFTALSTLAASQGGIWLAVISWGRKESDVTERLSGTEWGICAAMCTECCVFIPGESSNVTSLTTHVKRHISARNDSLFP